MPSFRAIVSALWPARITRWLRSNRSTLAVGMSMIGSTVVLPAELLLQMRAERNRRNGTDPPEHEAPERPLTRAERQTWDHLTETLQATDE